MSIKTKCHSGHHGEIAIEANRNLRSILLHKVANLTEPIGHHCLVRVSDHKLLLIGGTYSDGASHTTTYFYDSHQNVWTSGPNLTQPRFNSVQMALPNSIKVVCDRNLHHFAVIWLNIPIFCINLHSILGHNHPKKLFTDM